MHLLKTIEDILGICIHSSTITILKYIQKKILSIFLMTPMIVYQFILLLIKKFKPLYFTNIKI